MDSMQQESFLKRHRIFILLLLIGLLLRFLFMYFQGLSNDELSAWNRTQLTDWNSFWYYGVKAGDMHPVFYQAFLWGWVRIFGDSEWALRSTSILFYVLNSWIIYRMSMRFFSKQAGLALIALYAGLAFTVIHTVFARPYNSGTFFLLLSVWSIFALNASNKKLSGWHAGLVIGFLGAMLSHYFAFLTAGVIGVIALFYVQRSRIKDIVAAGVVSVLLFIPHWPVTRFQLDQGGLGWLAPPKWNWLVDFFHQFANNSWIVFAALAALVIFSLRRGVYLHQSPEEKFVLRIFIFTYITGHLVSVFYTPVLRELVMLYMLPFLFLYLFRGFSQLSERLVNRLLISLPVLLGLHSILYVHLLQPQNFGVFRELGQTVNKYEPELGNDNITYASDFCDVSYINYYYNKDVQEPIREWGAPETLYQLAARAAGSDKKYFIYNWSNNFHSPMYYEVIRRHFPYTLHHRDYFNAASTIFSKHPVKHQDGNLNRNVMSEGFENTFADSITSSEEFIGALKFPAKSFSERLGQNGYFLVEAEGVIQPGTTLYLAATLERNGQMVINGKDAVFYTAYDQSLLHTASGKRTFFCAFSIPWKLADEDIVHVYFWNPGKQPVYLEKAILSLVGSKN